MTTEHRSATRPGDVCGRCGGDIRGHSEKGPYTDHIFLTQNACTRWWTTGETPVRPVCRRHGCDWPDASSRCPEEEDDE